MGSTDCERITGNPEITEIRALIALKRHDSAKAIGLLQITVPYEQGQPQSSFFGFYGMFYPSYLRGQAYLAEHRRPAAAAEFQKVLDRPGIVISDPIGALARLQLGRAFALSGDKMKAKAAYEDFFQLWKHADPDIPILMRAHVEYANLN